MNGRLGRFARRFDGFEFLPARVKAREIFFGGGEFSDQLVALRTVSAVEIRRGKERLDAGDVVLGRVDLRLHAFEFARLLETEFARARRWRFRSGRLRRNDQSG